MIVLWNEFSAMTKNSSITLGQENFRNPTYSEMYLNFPTLIKILKIRDNANCVVA